VDGVILELMLAVH